MSIFYKMTLASFAANVDFSKSSLSSEGIAVERSDNTATAKLSEWFLLEQKPRVLQPPSCERTFALKNRPERETWQSHLRRMPRKYEMLTFDKRVLKY